MKTKKTLIFHDAFIYRSWTERININMANIFDADIATAIWSANSYEGFELGFHGKVIELFTKFYESGFWFLRMKWKFFFSGKITRNYERIIFSNEALTAIHHVPKWTETVYYAHTLPHELFDKREEYMKTVPVFFREIYALTVRIRRWLYLSELKKVGKIMTNSKMNRNWLEKWCHRSDIQVIYPPVNMLRFRPQKVKQPFIIQEHNNVESVIEKEIKDYYISSSRLKKNKRIERIIHAFIHMPEKNLIILYNPHDSEKQTLMRMASGHNNIFFHHEPTDMRMSQIIANSVATISLATDENFSMVSIESMACGIPMISVNEWASKESIIHEKTGILIPSDFTVYTIMDAVRSMTPEKSLSMKEACIARGKEFSLERFSHELREYVENSE
jgi:glycosyltransferase involved in cell wall biosynthesis